MMNITQNQIVDTVLNSVNKRKPPEILYHYTNNSGLLGIIDSKSLHLTDMSFLNDPYEVEFGFIESHKMLIYKMIEEYKKEESSEKVRKFIALIQKKMNEFSKILKTIDIYIICFCTNRDLLSQWKGYSNLGEGFAVGFQTSRITEIVEKNENIFFNRVIYSEKEFNDILKKFYDEIIIKLAIDNNLDADEDSFFVIYILTLLSIFYKNSSFKEEKEWRLVYLNKKDESKDNLIFKSSKYGISTHYKLSIEDLSIINKIIIGPKYNSFMNKKSLRLLKENKKMNFSIKSSKIELK